MPLPKGVHTSHGRYFLVRSGRWIPLSLVGEGPAALRAALSSVPATDDQLPPRNVGELLQRFLSSGLEPLRHAYSQPPSAASRRVRSGPIRARISGPFMRVFP
jgi:hypothetical protein